MQRSLAISLVALPILYWCKMSRRSRALGLRSVFECLPKSWSSRLCIGIVINGLYYIFWVWYYFENLRETESLSSVNVQITGKSGSDPISVINYAIKAYEDREK